MFDFSDSLLQYIIICTGQRLLVITCVPEQLQTHFIWSEFILGVSQKMK